MSMSRFRRTISYRAHAALPRARAVGLIAISGLILVRASTRAVAQAATAPASRSFVSAPSSRATTSKSPGSSWDLANIGNARVDQWVHRFATSLRTDFAASLSRGKAYVTMISEKLAERQMPQELTYLAMIESEFKPQAKSRASAVGLWQFVASTARQFGLTVRRGSDDRTNPIKETDAALTYLSQLHNRFGSWYLAAAAYNAGPGSVARALQHVMHRSTGTDADYYRISSYLPSETRDYVPKLIAAARIGKNPADYGFSG